MKSDPVLRGMVMEAIANDYETLDSIVEQIQSWVRAESPYTVTIGNVMDALLEIVGEGLAGAFELSPTTTPTRATDVDRNNVSAYYFLLSPGGKAQLGG